MASFKRVFQVILVVLLVCIALFYVHLHLHPMVPHFVAKFIEVPIWQKPQPVDNGSLTYQPVFSEKGSTRAAAVPESMTEIPLIDLINNVSGLELKNTKPIVLTLDQSPRDSENDFYRFVEQTQVVCKNSVRLGNIADGGWNMCIVDPYKPHAPCTIYSFGISNDWSFDDAVSSRYGCNVKAFDPSMSIGDHQHSKLVAFYHTGIGGTNTVNKHNWKIRTLGTLFKQLEDDNKVIDYLKVDIEYNEWESFKAMFAENDLSRVKQFGFEIHTIELLRRQSTVENFVSYWEALTGLEKIGFKKWYSHYNPLGPYFSQRTNQQRTCCYELVYINTNFLRSDYMFPTLDPSIGVMPSTTTTSTTTTTTTTRAPVLWNGVDMPQGLRIIETSPMIFSNDMSSRDAEEKFYRYVTTNTAECDVHKRMGHVADGGWDVCLVGPFTLQSPCIVYSFGINNDWSFDDAVSSRYGCEVKAFDPSMRIHDHKHSALVWFYQTGIGGTNRQSPQGWKIRTLGTLLKDIGDNKKTLDFVKIDIEYNEWESFNALFEEGTLKYVKQFAFEIHTHELAGGTPTRVDQFISYWRTLDKLQQIGFRQWHNHYNPLGQYMSSRTGRTRTCCYELYYVNTNFLIPGYDPSGV